MSFNLMEMVKGAVSEKTAAGMASVLGTDQQAGEKAADLALPALIGGLIKKSSTSTGASELFGMLDVFDGSQLDELDDAFDGGAKQDDWLSGGKGILETIFGGNLSSIVGKVAKATGMDSSTVGKLFSMLAPLVMGVLGKQKQAAGWDIGNFTSAMSEQKNHLGNLDSGILDSLGIGDKLDSAKDKVAGAATSAAGSAASAAGSAVDKAKEATSGGGSLVSLLVPLILIAILAFFGWQFFLSGNNSNNQGNGKAEEQSKPVDSNNGRIITQLFKGVREALQEVYDDDSAKAAAKKIDAVTKKIDEMNLETLSGAPRNFLGDFIRLERRRLNPVLEEAYEVPGAREIIEPSANELLDSIKDF